MINRTKLILHKLSGEELTYEVFLDLLESGFRKIFEEAATHAEREGHPYRTFNCCEKGWFDLITWSMSVRGNKYWVDRYNDFRMKYDELEI